MASKESIRQAILNVAGNPETGIIKELADDMADAVVAIDNPPSQGKKEKRVLTPTEIR
jgi:hypothetical protein